MMLRPGSYRNVLIAAWLLPLFSAAYAQQNDAPSDEKPESEVVLPAAPLTSELLPFYVSASTTLNFAVDGKSVSVSSDGIVRFTLVVTSPAGARNVSYEGIRCSSNERKLYATGLADGQWAPSRRNAWDPIRDMGANRQHAALSKDYFCEVGNIAGKADAMVERLRKKKPLR